MYNLFFHPLAKFPGPIQWRGSLLPWAYQFFRGEHPFSVLRLHEEYGPIVRISPSEISFSDPEAWKDIYGAALGKENPKHHTFYAAIGFNGVLSDEFTSAEKSTQKILKSILADGFSEKNIKRQERIIMGHVDLMIKRLREKCRTAPDASNARDETKPSPDGTVLDLTEWFCWLVCDIVGDLTLGTSFGCLQNLAVNPYVAFLFNACKIGGRVIVLWYLGLSRVVLFLAYMLGERFLKVLDETRAMLEARMESGEERDDLIGPIIRAHKDGVSYSRAARSRHTE